MTTVGLDCGTISIKQSQANSLEDYSFDVQFKTVLLEDIPSEANLESGVAVSDKNDLIILSFDTGISSNPSVNFSLVKCPADAVLIGSVTKVQFDLLAPLSLGDYTVSPSDG